MNLIEEFWNAPEGSGRIEDLATLERVGVELGNFMEMNYSEAIKKVKNIHPKAKLVIGMKCPPKEVNFVDEHIHQVTEEEWNNIQSNVLFLCGPDHLPKVYAVPNCYEIVK